MADNARTRFLKLLSCIQHGSVDINAPKVLVTDLDRMMYACAIDDDTYNDELVVYTVADKDPYTAEWLSLTEGGEPLTPEKGVLYIVGSLGTYKNKIYRWSGTSYLLLGGGEQAFTVTVTKDAQTTVAIVDQLSQAVTTSANFGDTLTITATAAENYHIKTLKVNGADFTSGESIIVTGHITIEAESAIDTYDLEIDATGCTVEVKVGDDIITAGTDAVSHGQTLTITATADEGKTLTTLTVKGDSFTSGQTHSVSDDVVIVAVAE